MPKKILVVDDDAKVVELVRLYLEKDHFQVLVAHDGMQAVETARQRLPDLIILDLMLPRIDGLEVARRLMSEKDVPIIMLTARRTEDDRLIGLELGADDYITKPFSPRELVARVRAVLRRLEKAHAAQPDEVHIGRLVVDYSRREARLEGRVLSLTPTEFNLLAHMAFAPGRVYSRVELLENVIGYNYDSLERTVDTHVMNLRRKLEQDPTCPRFIHTVYGQGYRVEYIGEGSAGET